MWGVRLAPHQPGFGRTSPRRVLPPDVRSWPHGWGEVAILAEVTKQGPCLPLGLCPEACGLLFGCPELKGTGVHPGWSLPLGMGLKPGAPRWCRSNLLLSRQGVNGVPKVTWGQFQGLGGSTGLQNLVNFLQDNSQVYLSLQRPQQPQKSCR